MERAVLAGKTWQMTWVFLSIRTGMRRPAFVDYLLSGRMTAVQSGLFNSKEYPPKKFHCGSPFSKICVDADPRSMRFPHSLMVLDLFCA